MMYFALACWPSRIEPGWSPLIWLSEQGRPGPVRACSLWPVSHRGFSERSAPALRRVQLHHTSRLWLSHADRLRRL